MKYLSLFDNIGLNEAKIQTILKFFDDANNKFVYLDDFSSIDFENNDYDKIVVFLTLSINFVPKKFLEMVEFLIKNKVNCKNISVVFVNDITSSSLVAINWINSIKSTYKVNIDVVGEIDINSLEDERFMLRKILKLDVNETIQEKDNFVTIYTDGACSGNPGPGGWGVVLMRGEKRKEISGFEAETTNNKMELTAVIKGLSALKSACKVQLYSDSAYVIGGFNQGWLDNWSKNGWKTADGKPVKNIELWQKLYELTQIHEVEFVKVKGHADNEFNNRCDELATGEIAKNA